MAGKGNDLVAQADKKLKEFAMPWNKTQKMEEAAEIYKQAAGQFKIAKEWDLAGETYLKAADLHDKLKADTEAASDYAEAGKAYKNSSPKDAVKALKIACSLHMDQNRFSSAAKLHKEIAQLEEKEMNNKGAIKAYTDAADCFQAEGSSATMNQMLLKVAELSASEMDYTRAIELYEKVSASALENRMQAYSVKEYLFKAGLCHLVRAAKSGVPEAVKETEDALEKYADMSPGFDNDRMGKLLIKCVEAFKAEDVDAFTDHVFKYDSISPLDTWTAGLLLEVKTILKSGGVPHGNSELGGELDLS